MKQPFEKPLVTIVLPPPTAWRVCQRCGHTWRTRSQGLRFRCYRCESRSRAAARAAARGVTGAGVDR